MSVTMETKRKLVREYAVNKPETLISCFTQPLVTRWGYRRRDGQDDEKAREDLLKYIRSEMALLMPDLEDVARRVVLGIKWPEEMPGPRPTFSQVMGSCARCNGTGDEGYTMRIRCRECGGTG